MPEPIKKPFTYDTSPNVIIRRGRKKFLEIDYFYGLHSPPGGDAFKTNSVFTEIVARLLQ